MDDYYPTKQDCERIEPSLLDCPFCGARPKMKYIGNAHTRSRKIEVKCTGPCCRVTQTNGAIRFGFKWLEGVAATAWNQRATANGEAGE